MPFTTCHQPIDPLAEATLAAHVLPTDGPDEETNQAHQQLTQAIADTNTYGSAVELGRSHLHVVKYSQVQVALYKSICLGALVARDMSLYGEGFKVDVLSPDLLDQHNECKDLATALMAALERIAELEALVFGPNTPGTWQVH